jgi:hypothetical protein
MERCFCNLELNTAELSLLHEFLFFSYGRITYPRNGTSLSVSILKRTLHGADDRQRHNRCYCQRYRHTAAPPSSDRCEADVDVVILL